MRVPKKICWSSRLNNTRTQWCRYSTATLMSGPYACLTILPKIGYLSICALELTITGSTSLMITFMVMHRFWGMKRQRLIVTLMMDCLKSRKNVADFLWSGIITTAMLIQILWETLRLVMKKETWLYFKIISSTFQSVMRFKQLTRSITSFMKSAVSIRIL